MVSLNILIGFERWGMVRDAFIKRGHNAISCDILPTVSPGPHIQDSMISVLERDDWDIIIAFPPCTHLAVSGAKHFAQKIKDGRQKQGIDLFMCVAKHKCPKIAIENPIGIMSNIWRKPDQIIQPFWFGDSFKKSTCLWLRGLPRLNATNIVDEGEYVIHGGKKFQKWYTNRSRER